MTGKRCLREGEGKGGEEEQRRAFLCYVTAGAVCGLGGRARTGTSRPVRVGEENGSEFQTVGGETSGQVEFGNLLQ